MISAPGCIGRGFFIGGVSGRAHASGRGGPLGDEVEGVAVAGRSAIAGVAPVEVEVVVGIGVDVGGEVGATGFAEGGVGFVDALDACGVVERGVEDGEGDVELQEVGVVWGIVPPVEEVGGGEFHENASEELVVAFIDGVEDGEASEGDHACHVFGGEYAIAVGVELIEGDLGGEGGLTLDCGIVFLAGELSVACFGDAVLDAAPGAVGELPSDGVASVVLCVADHGDGADARGRAEGEKGCEAGALARGEEDDAFGVYVVALAELPECRGVVVEEDGHGRGAEGFAVELHAEAIGVGDAAAFAHAEEGDAASCEFVGVEVEVVGGVECAFIVGVAVRIVVGAGAGAVEEEDDGRG